MTLRLLLSVLWIGAALVARAELRIVTTLPDFAALARQIGGDQVKVDSLAKGTEDAHFVDARPGYIRLLNRADLLVEGGADLEIGWLPPLVRNARNRDILPEGKGYLDASLGIDLLEVPSQAVDRSLGDVHAHGNPHYWLDPVNGGIMAARLAEAMGRLDPGNAVLFQANLKGFQEQLDRKLEEWTARMQPLRGVKILTYHKTFEYLGRRFGLVIEGQLEPKPGIEPSPAHLADLIPRAKEAQVKLVVIEPYRSRKTPEFVAQSIGAKLVLLPDKVEGHPDIRDYFDLFDHAVKVLTSAMEGAE